MTNTLSKPSNYTHHHLGKLNSGKWHSFKIFHSKYIISNLSGTGASIPSTDQPFKILIHIVLKYIQFRTS